MTYRIFSSRILVGWSQKWPKYSQCLLKRTLVRVRLLHKCRHDIVIVPLEVAAKNTSFKTLYRSKSYIHCSKVSVKMDAGINEGSHSHARISNLSAPPTFTPAMDVGEADGWLNIGAYSVFAWSISGVESCVIVKSEDVQIVFDMGMAVKESVKVPNVFITHGHIDHIGGLVNHISKRSLFGMKPARYFAPPHLVDNMKTAVQAYHVMAETGPSGEDVNILSMSEGDTVQLNSRFFVKSFPTIHRIPSQGYIVYKEEKTLKEEFRGVDGFEVSALHRAGKEIHDVTITPEIAYTGDTVIDVFNNPPIEDLLRVKLLITEATYLEVNDKRGNSMVEKAKARGHIHLVELAQNAHLFDKVGHILLVHFSSKYSPKYICDSIRDKLPPDLRAKVTPATVAAATRPTTHL